MGRARKRKTQDALPPPAAPDAPVLAAGARAVWLVAGAVFVAALVAYGLTLAPTVTLVDSGELIVAARNLGVPHPPGFPLYASLAHVAARVPVGTVAQRVNAFSAAGAALAAAALAWAVARATRPSAVSQGVAADAVAAAPLAIAGLLLAFSRTVWAYATVSEVYTLTTLAVVLLVGLALRAGDTRAVAGLTALAGAYGLATGTHHVTIALVGPGLLALAWRPLRETANGRRLALWALAGFGAAAAAYLYLPWRAAHDSFPNWGDPRTLERLWWHVSGRQYQAYLTPSVAGAGEEAAAFLRAMGTDLGPAWCPAALVLAALGLRAAWRRERSLAAGLLLVIACDLAYALLYTIAEDKDAYYLPTVVVLCLAAGLGAHDVLSRVRRRGAWALGLLAVPLLAAAVNARAADRSRDWIAHDFARDALAGVAPGGLLLTSEWQLYSPLLYFQEVEGWRPDVMAVDVSLLRRSWYVDGLRRRYPDRWAPLATETDAFLEDLRAWESDPALYERDQALGRRINDRFQAMVLALARSGAARGPAYVTSDVVLPPSPDPSLAERFVRSFPLTPRGIVFSLRAPEGSDPPPDLHPRGLFDGSVRLAPDGVASLKVRPVYLSMAVNRGKLLLLQGDGAGAEAAFRRALAWDPEYGPARQELGRLSPGR